MYIELSIRYDTSKIMVNCNHIVYFAPCGNGSVVRLNDHTIDVVESYAEIAQKISMMGERMASMPWIKREGWCNNAR